MFRRKLSPVSKSPKNENIASTNIPTGPIETSQESCSLDVKQLCSARLLMISRASITMTAKATKVQVTRDGARHSEVHQLTVCGCHCTAHLDPTGLTRR